jgi:hypothetical protein
VGSPKFVKMVFWLAVLIGGGVLGVRWLQHNPHAADLQKTQPGVYQPQPPAQPGGNSGNMVVVP